MAVCPSCKDEVDVEAELCLGCGEPLDPAQLKAQGKPPAVTTQPVRAAAPPSRPTIAASPIAKRRRQDEPEAVRCPGCGAPSKAERCPGCGAVLRRD